MPIFSLLYTTRRVHVACDVIRKWLRAAQRVSDIEIVLSMDNDYAEGLSKEPSIRATVRSEFPTVGYRFIQSPSPGNCVKGWNSAATMATGKVFIALSDDFDPCANWDAELFTLRECAEFLRDGRWIDGDYAVHVHDGLYGDLCTLGIITAKRYHAFGYMYYPGYQSMYTDTELTHRASQDSALIDARYLRFQHKHHSVGVRTEDSVDVDHNSKSRYKTGEILYAYRQHRGFPIDAGPMAEKYIVTDQSDIASTYAVYIQAIRDDLCLLDTCHRLVEEGLRNFFFFIPTESWSGSPTPKEQVEEVKSIAAAVATLAPNTKCSVALLPVAPHRPGAESRIVVETRCRNASLDRIQSAGFRHAIVVDGDEVWMRGFMNKLHDYVKSCQPEAVSCRNVPVVGLPGYPVDDAKDKVLVYIRLDQRFRDCRSPFCFTQSMPDFGLFHFSGVRKTFDEIVNKMRNSGHYDDPSYKFEDFIKDTLPNIKPGLENVHMYSGYQIWPRIRYFTPTEIDNIPTSLYRYLCVDPEAQRIAEPAAQPRVVEDAYA